MLVCVVSWRLCMRLHSGVSQENIEATKCVNQKVKECFSKDGENTYHIQHPHPEENPTTRQKYKRKREERASYKRICSQSKTERGKCKETGIIKYELYSTID